MSEGLEEAITINGLVPGAGQCVATGCGEHCGKGTLMCQRHWKMVPLMYKSELWSTFTRWVEGGRSLAELRDIQKRCVAAVEQHGLAGHRQDDGRETT